MKLTALLVAAAASLFALDQAWAQPPAAAEQYEITHSYETSHESSDGSTGSSRGHDRLLERVLGAQDGGTVLEYDDPKDASAEDRERSWQFPARVLRLPDGRTVLLNRADLEARLARWLAAAGWGREVCGRWIFTWNAFRIECDPESVLATIAERDLRSTDLRVGGLYRDRSARGSGALHRIADGPEGPRVAAVLEIDPEAVRRARAEADVAFGEMTGTPVTLSDAGRVRALENVSGTLEVMFDIDSAGRAWRRTKVTRIQITEPGGRSETRRATETVERRLMSGAAGGR